MQEKTKSVQLIEITAANWRQALTLSVQPQQLQFVAQSQPIVAIALAKAYVKDSDKHWQPYAISDQQSMLGFVALAYSATQPEHVWIYHFFIDQYYQGQGYGKAALRAIISMLKQRQSIASELHLLVHPANLAAQQLYISQGFRPTGRIIDGEVHYQLKLA